MFYVRINIWSHNSLFPIFSPIEMACRVLRCPRNSWSQEDKETILFQAPQRGKVPRWIFRQRQRRTEKLLCCEREQGSEEERGCNVRLSPFSVMLMRPEALFSIEILNWDSGVGFWFTGLWFTCPSVNFTGFPALKPFSQRRRLRGRSCVMLNDTCDVTYTFVHLPLWNPFNGTRKLNHKIFTLLVFNYSRV